MLAVLALAAAALAADGARRARRVSRLSCRCGWYGWSDALREEASGRRVCPACGAGMWAGLDHGWPKPPLVGACCEGCPLEGGARKVCCCDTALPESHPDHPLRQIDRCAASRQQRRALERRFRKEGRL